MKGISTKGTRKGIVVKTLCIGVLVFVVFISFCCMTINMMPSGRSSSDELEPTMAMAALCGIVAIVIPAILLFSSAKYSKTYVEINQETITGEGIEMINGNREGGVVYFHLKYAELKNMSVKSGWITLYTYGITYRILTDKNTAMDIYRYYNENKI